MYIDGMRYRRARSGTIGRGAVCSSLPSLCEDPDCELTGRSVTAVSRRVHERAHDSTQEVPRFEVAGALGYVLGRNTCSTGKRTPASPWRPRVRPRVRCRFPQGLLTMLSATAGRFEVFFRFSSIACLDGHTRCS